MAHVGCSCGGSNENCYRCYGRGFVEIDDPERAAIPALPGEDTADASLPAPAQAPRGPAIVLDASPPPASPAARRGPTPQAFGLTDQQLADLRAWNDRRAAWASRIWTVYIYIALGAWLWWFAGVEKPKRVVEWVFFIVKGCWFFLFVGGVHFALLDHYLDNGHGLIARGLRAVLLPSTRPDPRPAAFDAAVARWNDEQERLKEEFWTQISGPAFEREVAALLRRLGHQVRRVGGAGDEGIDLWRDDTPVQCKQHQTALGPRVVRELLGACASVGAKSGILVTTRGVSRAAGDYAKQNGIEVWGLEMLTHLADQASADPQPKGASAAWPGAASPEA